MVQHKHPCWLSALVVGQLLLCTTLPAAIVQTGDVSPDVSSWTDYTWGYIGDTSHGSVLVDEGSVLTSREAVLGRNPGITGTTMVMGAGSRWTNIAPFSGNLYVGGSGNGILTIDAGGEVRTTNAYLGNNAGSTGTAAVTGLGSRWTNSVALYVGNVGNGTLTVSDGGEVIAAIFYASLSDLFGDGTITATNGAVLDADLLFNATEGNQKMVPFGSGGTLTFLAAGGVLGAGYKQSGSLTVSDGASISSSTGYLGYQAGSTGTATVAGNGSKWINSGELYVGRLGEATLTVSDGGEVVAGRLYASLSDLLGDGLITATQGAVLDADLSFDATQGNQSTFSIGSGGTLTVQAAGGELGAGYKQSGSLVVRDGINISSSRGYLGYDSGSTGIATVVGAGSEWTIGGLLNVGREGDGTLTVQEGGQVSNGSGNLGRFSGSMGLATVTGAGSKWTNSSILFVGRGGDGTLVVEEGGQVSNTNGLLGYDSGSTGTATVTGAGSKWTSSGALYVGNRGNGTLTVLDGGEVVAGTLYSSLSDLFGDGTITATQGALLDADLVFDATHGNQASVTFGTGGTLNVQAAGGELGVGYKKNGSLGVSDGVTISSSTGSLGYDPGSTGTAIVTGEGSRWTNVGNLVVGRWGDGTLTVEAGGQVSNTNGYVGRFSGSTSTATVIGEGFVMDQHRQSRCWWRISQG